MKRILLDDIITLTSKNRIAFWFKLIIFLISAVNIAACVIDYGFVLTEKEQNVIFNIYNTAWWCYCLTFFIRLIFQWKKINRKTIFLTSITGILFLLTALPKLYPITDVSHNLYQLWMLLENKHLLIATLLFFAILEVSSGIINFINKKTNPAMLMTVCFAIIILFGALLLLLPRSTQENIVLPVADAIFISTSAVCVTGLSTVDVAQTFTYEGQIIIALLIQIGGLGIMTITSFFAIFFMGGTGLYNQFALRDMIGSETFSSLISTLLYILGFTFAIEAAGAFFIWLSIHSTMNMSLHQEIFFSIFHSISAFCNAGFSTLSGNLGNPMIMNGHNAFYIIISVLIVLGGLGFPILMNFKKIFSYKIGKVFDRIFKREKHRPFYSHVTNINTKIVLSMTSILIFSGTMIIAINEWNGAFAGMSFIDKIVQSLFNAIVPRTAGFNSVDLTQFSFITIIFYSLLMWIGGGSQSTAGGIKVNTFAVAMANFISVIKGQNNVRLFNREIESNSIRRASSIIFGSILIILIFFVGLVMMEPEISLKGLLFETISAFSTVGASLNVTPLLSDGSKIWLTFLMFIGRVGLITFIMSFIKHTETPKYRLPKDNVIIN